MRVLIVSVTTGYGHHSTAVALAEQFAASGVSAVVEDMYEYCSNFLYTFMDRGYLFTTRYMRKTFGHAYDHLESSGRFRKLATLLSSNQYVARKFAAYFHEFQPDAVISTHPFASQVLNILKAQGELRIPVVGIITDYCIHPFLEECDQIDYLVTASPLLHYAACAKGIHPDRLRPFGLPVRPCFLQRMEPAQARAKLGLPIDGRVILLMGGSMGYGKLLPTVEEMLKDQQSYHIICICGTNGKLADELRTLHDPRLTVLGFVDNVNEYMDAADCIITKPGGLTTTELIVKHLPAILINPIPGHEQRNLEFLVNNGGAIAVSPRLGVNEALHYLFYHPKRLPLMRSCLELLALPNAARDICDFVEQLAGGTWQGSAIRD